MSYRGKFTPQNRTKYLGDASNIVWRSLWERKFMKYCDETPGILKWASEEFHVPYISPVDSRPHRYFPDFYLEVQSNSGLRHFVIEIKPQSQSVMPATPKRRTKRYLAEVMTFAINQAKWEACKSFCHDRGWTFLVLTEQHLFDRFK